MPLSKRDTHAEIAALSIFTSKPEAEGVFALAGDLVLGGKGGAAGVGADSAHGKVKAYVDKGVLGQLVVVLRLAQLPCRVGIDRCGEGLFRVQGS